MSKRVKTETLENPSYESGKFKLMDKVFREKVLDEFTFLHEEEKLSLSAAGQKIKEKYGISPATVKKLYYGMSYKEEVCLSDRYYYVYDNYRSLIVRLHDKNHLEWKVIGEAVKGDDPEKFKNWDMERIVKAVFYESPIGKKVITRQRGGKDE